jgi:hypothetical protein
VQMAPAPPRRFPKRSQLPFPPNSPPPRLGVQSMPVGTLGSAQTLPRPPRRPKVACAEEDTIVREPATRRAESNALIFIRFLKFQSVEFELPIPHAKTVQNEYFIPIILNYRQNYDKKEAGLSSGLKILSSIERGGIVSGYYFTEKRVSR